MKDLTPLDIHLGHATRPGPRSANEDFVAAAMPEGAERAAKGVLLAIVDGVGGHAHGREAAEYTVRSLLADYFSTAHTWSVEKSLDTVLGAGYGIFSGKDVRWATLRFTPERARWVAGERWHPQQQGRVLADGSYELKLPYSKDPELLMDILKFGADCTVVAPKELRARVAAEVRRMAEAYAAPAA